MIGPPAWLLGGASVRRRGPGRHRINRIVSTQSRVLQHEAGPFTRVASSSSGGVGEGWLPSSERLVHRAIGEHHQHPPATDPTFSRASGGRDDYVGIDVTGFHRAPVLLGVHGRLSTADCCASTCPATKTSPATAPNTSTVSPRASTPDPAKPWAGCSPQRPTLPPLQPPPEAKIRIESGPRHLNLHARRRRLCGISGSHRKQGCLSGLGTRSRSAQGEKHADDSHRQHAEQHECAPHTAQVRGRRRRVGARELLGVRPVRGSGGVDDVGGVLLERAPRPSRNSDGSQQRCGPSFRDCVLPPSAGMIFHEDHLPGRAMCIPVAASVTADRAGLPHGGQWGRDVEWHPRPR
jgi:hypothetical protein